MTDNGNGILELRRYITHPAKRDVLIDLFERHFLESQEACGMLPLGHFRNLDDPDAFVWLRAFPDMASRGAALKKFYLNSASWLENRDAANATMVNSDNVLLLRNARESSGIDLLGLSRPGLDQDVRSDSFIAVSVQMFDRPDLQKPVTEFERIILPGIKQFARRIGYFVSEQSPNNFPKLPVREAEFALVAVGSCSDEQALAQWVRTFAAGPWEVLRLQPAARSLYR